MFDGDATNVEAVRSLYERLELRLWSILPKRMRRRLTTYGIAELTALPPLGEKERSTFRRNVMRAGR
jgi:hypothetical protein